jgi:hypothetical protein
MRARLTPLCSLIVLAVAGSLPAHAATLIDNANGYTLNTKGDLVQFTALAFDDASTWGAARCCLA